MLMECQKCTTRKQDYSYYPSTCVCENSKYLKSVVDALVT